MMPIRAENRSRYPADWPVISRRVRNAAGNCCEQCGVRNGAVIYRGSHGTTPAWRYEEDPVFTNSLSPFDGTELHATCWDDFDRHSGPVKVILTVAHLDHTPENCALDNLRALCQRCHNSYDAARRRAGIADRARANRAAADLFEGKQA